MAYPYYIPIHQTEEEEWERFRFRDENEALEALKEVYRELDFIEVPVKFGENGRLLYDVTKIKKGLIFNRDPREEVETNEDETIETYERNGQIFLSVLVYDDDWLE